MFAAPRWEGGRIGFVIRRLPDPEEGETIEQHAERWRAAYLGALREFLAGEPENLRLSGGIWRHIRVWNSHSMSSGPRTPSGFSRL